MRISARAGAALGLIIMLAGCDGFVGPRAPGTACPEISPTRFAELVAGGATQAEATIAADGTSSIVIGAGVVQCASGSRPRACRRPNDFVIRYALPGGKRMLVHVPAGSQYRLRAAAQPTTCEIVAPK